MPGGRVAVLVLRGALLRGKRWAADVPGEEAPLALPAELGKQFPLSTIRLSNPEQLLDRHGILFCEEVVTTCLPQRLAPRYSL